MHGRQKGLCTRKGDANAERASFAAALVTVGVPLFLRIKSQFGSSQRSEVHRVDYGLLRTEIGAINDNEAIRLRTARTQTNGFVGY